MSPAELLPCFWQVEKSRHRKAVPPVPEAQVCVKCLRHLEAQKSFQTENACDMGKIPALSFPVLKCQNRKQSHRNEFSKQAYKTGTVHAYNVCPCGAARRLMAGMLRMLYRGRAANISPTREYRSCRCAKGLKNTEWTELPRHSRKVCYSCCQEGDPSVTHSSQSGRDSGSARDPAPGRQSGGEIGMPVWVFLFSA